ncbi:sarcosine oxidase subunit delta [Sandarakinorhabdus sp. DWP1-3-1]|uniref:sarcosine oxidase subunit delta n=1 Tax=Sandarakinorhabdus sp. DWP1-3-1 TaxID=2804627 RepID=UPI003CF3E6BF
MQLIPCPWCGPRDEIEFRCDGEARPARPLAAGDAEWADHLFMRTNRRGVHVERWLHVHGCRRWFDLTRDTARHRVLGSGPIGDAS